MPGTASAGDGWRCTECSRLVERVRPGRVCVGPKLATAGSARCCSIPTSAMPGDSGRRGRVGRARAEREGGGGLQGPAGGSATAVPVTSAPVDQRLPDGRGRTARPPRRSSPSAPVDHACRTGWGRTARPPCDGGHGTGRRRRGTGAARGRPGPSGQGWRRRSCGGWSSQASNAAARQHVRQARRPRDRPRSRLPGAVREPATIRLRGGAKARALHPPSPRTRHRRELGAARHQPGDALPVRRPARRVSCGSRARRSSPSRQTTRTSGSHDARAERRDSRIVVDPEYPSNRTVWR